MHDPLLHKIKSFFLKKSVGNPVILLGYSGGGDSTALLHFLLECRQKIPFDLHLAHIDHGWRKESAQECKELESKAEKLNLPFHSCRLSPPEKNLEDWSRNERFIFFKKIYSQIGAKALLLGQHADDQAETVLKRLLEGANFLSSGGMREESEMMGMNIWRPLLSVSKKELTAWLEQRSIAYFTDPTNCDLRYLRSRMREEVIPYLNQLFGKNVEKNLCYFGEAMESLRQYLYKRISQYLSVLQVEGNESSLPIAYLPKLEKWELRAFLDHQEVNLTRTAFDNLWNALDKKVFPKKIITKTHHLFLERDYLKIKTL